MMKNNYLTPKYKKNEEELLKSPKKNVGDMNQEKLENKEKENSNSFDAKFSSSENNLDQKPFIKLNNILTQTKMSKVEVISDSAFDDDNTVSNLLKTDNNLFYSNKLLNVQEQDDKDDEIKLKNLNFESSNNINNNLVKLTTSKKKVENYQLRKKKMMSLI